MSELRTNVQALLLGSKNAKRIKRTTPVGVAIFPHLLKPDPYQLEKNNKEECNTDLKLDPSNEKDAAFIAEITELNDVAFAEGKAQLEAQLSEAKGKKLVELKQNIADLKNYPPFKPEYNDDGEETGCVIFSMKTKVGGIDDKTKQKWQRKVAIFDAGNPPVEVKGAARDEMKLWGGSRIAVSLEVVPYCAPGLKKAGVSLRILAVQVVSLSGTGGGTAESHGFGVEEGGFKSERFRDDDTGVADPSDAVDAAAAGPQEDF